MNKFRYINYEGEKCVKFITNGKYNEEVLVDTKSWDDYLKEHNWTIIRNKSGYMTVKTSIDILTVKIYKLIVKKELLELDYWGKTIDHKNNNSLDNRKKNLRLYTSKLNATNILSKNKKNDMHMIFPQYSNTKKRGKYIRGYKVHVNIFDEVKYKNFKSINEAKKYRDDELIPYIDKRIKDMEKKNRDIEFERGLRDKLRSSEKDEIIKILKKYEIQIQSY